MLRSCNCPSCGAEVKFRNAASVFAVCAYCRSTLVRHDVDVEVLGRMAQLNDDWSPLQINTQGKYQNVNFSLIGRVRLRWERGTWDEWLCLYDDARTGWLSEAQGIYHLSFPAEQTALPQKESLLPGMEVVVQGIQYTVTDIKDATCAYSEGELPFTGVVGRRSTSVDLTSTGSHFACIDYSDDGVQAYCGHRLGFKDLGFSLLREIDGWGKPG